MKRCYFFAFLGLGQWLISNLMARFSIMFVVLAAYHACYSQHKINNDWFDFNLKAQPKSVAEIETVSLLTFFESTDFFNSPCKLMMESNEFTFDAGGYLLTERHKRFYDSIEHSINYGKIKRNYVNDSTIVLRSVVNRMIEKITLDKDGFIKMRIKDRDTIQYTRNARHAIIRTYHSMTGIDTKVIIVQENELNENGDIIRMTEKRLDIDVSPKEERVIVMTDFTYTYDKKGNWISRVGTLNREVTSIAQRKIVY